MRNNIHLQRIVVSVLTVALVLGVTVCPVSADTINQVTPDTYATIFDTLLQQQSTGTCSNVDTLPQFILDCMPTGYDWNLVSWFDSGYGYYDIGFAVVPDGYYPIQLNAGAIYQTVSMPDLFNTCCFGTYTISTGATSGFSIQEDNNSFIMIYYHSKDNYVHFFKNTQFNMGGQSYEVVVPVIDPVNPSNPNYPSGNPYNPTVPTDWDNYTEMIAGLLYDNFKFSCNNTVYNATWMPVGEYLMYDFLCKNNPQNDTVSFNNWEYQNYIYRICGLNHEDDVITIMELLDDISYYHGNYLSSISNSLNYDPEYDLGFAYNVITPLNTIAQVYEDLYPEDAREMTATMEEELYDSENGGTSLTEMQTVFGVGTESRDAFDTGASFSLSGLFSFKNDGNWGFWSTQCQNDMDNVPQVRKSENYDSTAYNDQLEELMSIWGLGNNDK